MQPRGLPVGKMWLRKSSHCASVLSVCLLIAILPSMCAFSISLGAPKLVTSYRLRSSAVPLRSRGILMQAKDDTSKGSATAIDPLSSMKGQADTMGKFMKKLGEYRECKDKEERTVMEGDIIEMYVDFAVPALALALGTLIAFPGAFLLFFVLLNISGRGLPDITALCASLPEPLSSSSADLLGKVDPTLGNAAVAAVLVELASPLLLLLSAAVKVKIEVSLNEKLPEWGFDAEGLRRRLERLAGPDGDLFK